MNKIRELPKSSAHLLTSSQIITSVHNVIKELVENSLDSGTSLVEVKLENYGLEKIEVKDSGPGIHKEDIKFVAKAHCTSKITSHLDLNDVQTYGFRGEALGALCAVSDFSITTKQKDEEYGSTYTFDSNGNVVSSKPCPCTPGTTVTATNIFKNIPVRKQYYKSEKNKREELKKVENILSVFGCIHSGVRFALCHNRNVIWQKTPATKIRDALIQILGANVVQQIENCEIEDDESKIKIQVFLPREGTWNVCGSSSTNHTIVAINKRPVRMKVIDKLLKDYYSKSLERPKYPMCYVEITVPPSEVDVNIEPNKTSVVLLKLDVIIEKLTAILKTFYEDPISIKKVPKHADEHATSKAKLPPPTNNAHLQKPVTIPLIQLKPQTSLSLKSKPVDNIIVPQPSFNLTRECDLSTPPSKKIKSDSSSITPNQVHRHIKDMQEFLVSSEQASTKETHNKENSAFLQNIADIGKLTEFPSNFQVQSSVQPLSTTVQRPSNYAPDTNLMLSDVVKNSGDRISAVKNDVQEFKTVSAIISDSASASSVTTTTTLDTRPRVSDLEWSKGNHLSKISFEPVTLLKPAISRNTSESNSKDIAIVETMKDVKEISVNGRRMTPFDFFCRRYRLEVSLVNPGLNNTEIAKILNERWNKLTTEEKEDFNCDTTVKDKRAAKVKERLATVMDGKTKTKDSKSCKAKKRRLRQEKVIAFNFNNLKIATSSSQSQPNEKLNLLKCIASGIWICANSSTVFVLNTFRLQEVVIYHRLLETFEFPIEALETPIVIHPSSLESDLLEVLIQMSSLCVNNQEHVLEDDKLIANGFHLRFLKSEHDICLEIVGITKEMAFYGKHDLIEILKIIKEKGETVNLSDCRPGKAILYLQGEAVRTARQNSPIDKSEDVEELLEQKDLFFPHSNICIHHKPYLHEIASIPDVFK